MWCNLQIVYRCTFIYLINNYCTILIKQNLQPNIRNLKPSMNTVYDFNLQFCVGNWLR